METRAFELPALEAPPGLPSFPGIGTASHQVDLVAEVEAACAAGHLEGLEAGRAEARQEVAGALAALQAAIAGIEQERERVTSAVEGATVELALRIAEQALGAAVDVDPARVVEVVRGAMRRLVQRDRLTVLVNPDDLELVREAAPALVAELGGIVHCDVQAERRVARGGAIVRTVEGEVDATLTTKLARVREVLEEELRHA